jgi:hypothetical protein
MKSMTLIILSKKEKENICHFVGKLQNIISDELCKKDI